MIGDTPALPPSAKDSTPDRGIWVTLPGSGDQRAGTDGLQYTEYYSRRFVRTAKDAENAGNAE